MKDEELTHLVRSDAVKKYDAMSPSQQQRLRAGRGRAAMRTLNDLNGRLPLHGPRVNSEGPGQPSGAN